MDRFEIQKLDAKPIETVAERLGISVARHKALCPFHDDHHASLKFNLRRNTCRCYVCMDCNMGPIRLVMAVRRVDFIEACRWLTEMGGGVWEGPGSRTSAGGWNGGGWNGGGGLRNGSYGGGGLSNGGLGGGGFANSSSGGGRLSNASGYGNSGYGGFANGSSGGVGFGNSSFSGGGLGNGGLAGGGESASPKPEPVFDSARYERFFIDPWLSDEARRFLFTDRRLDERVVSWCRLTSWTDKHGIPWLCTPYFDPGGRLIGVQNRNLAWQGTSDKSPRFRFPWGARCTIYGLQIVQRLKDGDELYITEGCSDCWAMLSSGHKAIAIPSATLLSEDDARLLTDLSESLHLSWHMYPDRDLPGERLFLQLREILPNLEHHQLPPGCKDYSEKFLTER